MTFFSDQLQSQDDVFWDNLPIDLLTDEELDRACQLASMLGQGAASFLFFFLDSQLVLKSSVGIVTPEEFLPILATLDSSDGGVAAPLPPTIQEPAGLKFSGCVWMRGREDKVVGGIALFSEMDAQLNEYQVNALAMLGQSLVDSLAQKAELQRSRSFEKIFNFSNDLVCIISFKGNFETINP